MLKKVVALLVFMVFLTLIVIPVTQARTKEQIRDDIQHLSEQINILEAEGKYSNDEVSSILVNFSSVTTTGSVTMAVYEGVYQVATVKDFKVDPLPWEEAEQQLVKYTLGNIANLYQAEPYNTDITCKTYEKINSEPQPRTIIPIYICGPYKAQATAELFAGIPECFTIKYYPPESDGSDGGGGSGYSGRMSVPVKPIPTPVADYSQYGLLRFNAMNEVFKAMQAALEAGNFNDFVDSIKNNYYLFLLFNFFSF